MTRRLRQVIDLYTKGTVVALRDGLPVWVQPLNPFEADTARNEANIAKARMSLALRDHASEEQLAVREFLFSEGAEGARLNLVEAKVNEASPKVFSDLRTDPEWREKMQILDRGAEGTAQPLTEPERELLQKLALEYSAELGKRLAAERDYWTNHYEALDEDALWDDYFTWWIDRRAGQALMGEYRQYQVLFGVRVCEGRHIDADAWDHSGCDGHQGRLFDTLEEVRSAPEDLLVLLYEAIDNIEMSALDAKNSDRQGSSSDSSPLPSEEEGSTPSTPQETRVAPPGSSSTPSPTPSQSLAGVS